MPQTMKRLTGACILALCLFLLLPCAASRAAFQTARDVAAQCKLKASHNDDTTFQIKNTALSKIWNGGAKGSLTVTLPGKEKAQGVMLAFNVYVPRLVVESLDGETPRQIARYDQNYYNAYIAFSEPAHSFRIRADKDNKKAVRIARMNVLTQGKLPSWVQQWKTMEDGQADILLMVTHPDDDILWFGGLLPTYAGQRKYKVMVGYTFIGHQWYRRNELLDALWHCGVRYYPCMPEEKVSVTKKKRIGYIVTCLRKYRPSVVVTQDIKGEYGHKEHVRVVSDVIRAVTRDSRNKSVSPSSYKKYGVYQPQKLYVHLYPRNQSVFNWNRKLSAFGGKTGMTLAREAFKMHVSQQNGRHAVLDHGAYDCRKMGLYWSRVGRDDVKKPDLMQHVINEKNTARP